MTIEGEAFIGRTYEEEEIKGIRKAFRQWSAEAKKPLEGEPEKTEEEITMVKTINALIRAELRSLGIKKYKPMPPERIHILPEEVFKTHFPESESNLFYKSTVDAVYANTGKADTKARMLSGLLHELLHRASANKFYADREGSVYDARVGYRIRSPWKEPDREDRLRGFNEIMTEMTNLKILRKNKPRLEKELGISGEDIEGPIYNYMEYAPILASIVRKLSRDTGKTGSEVYDDLERGLFQNNILVLKNVEHSFGEGSLELLSLLETLEKKEDNDVLKKMIQDFFAEEDNARRQALRPEILAFVEKARRAEEQEK